MWCVYYINKYIDVYICNIYNIYNMKYIYIYIYIYIYDIYVYMNKKPVGV